MGKFRVIFIALTCIGIVGMILFSIPPINVTVDNFQHLNSQPGYEYPIPASGINPDQWIYLSISSALILIGIFIAKLYRLRILILAIGGLSILSVSGEYVFLYQWHRYIPDTFEITEALSAVKLLLPGIACIIGGIMLRRVEAAKG
jgi:hypothetical protein